MNQPKSKPIDKAWYFDCQATLFGYTLVRRRNGTRLSELRLFQGLLHAAFILHEDWKVEFSLVCHRRGDVCIRGGMGAKSRG